MRLLLKKTHLLDKREKSMQPLEMPLVESLIAAHGQLNFARVKILGVQHILETTHAMFQYLYRLGLKPENVSLLGKCYSTCKEVYEEMVEDGIDVSIGSFSYAHEKPFDELFVQEVQSFLSLQIAHLSPESYDLIIVLDDGGKCIEFLRKHLQHKIPLVAIEQTSAGYHEIRSHFLPFPVINVARSPVKLTLESPMIAEAASERLYASLKKKEVSVDKALVIGGGAIGQAIRSRLSLDMDITIYDKDPAFSDCKTTHLEHLISQFPLIIGCTGKTSISHHWHSLFAPQTTLVSVSSSDREFDAHHLRKQITGSSDCHKDLIIKDLLLINSGFPVNFDGDRENIAVEKIQLTIALITAGILQAKLYHSSLPSGIIPVDKHMEESIQDSFLQKSILKNHS